MHRNLKLSTLSNLEIAMAKRALIIVVMIVMSIGAILCVLGWTRVSWERESQNTEVKSVEPERSKEIKIVAVEEQISKIPASLKKKDVPVKKRPKTKPAPTKKLDVAKRSQQTQREPSVKETRSASISMKKVEKKKGGSKPPLSRELRLSPRLTERSRSLID